MLVILLTTSLLMSFIKNYSLYSYSFFTASSYHSWTIIHRTLLKLSQSSLSFLNVFFLLCWSFMAVQAFLQLWQARLLFLAVCGLLIVIASLVGEHGLWSVWASVAMSCGIFLDQESKLCLLHWQADSLPWSHQGSPKLTFFK